MNEYKILKNGVLFADGISAQENTLDILEEWLDSNGFYGEYDELLENKNGSYVIIENDTYKIELL